MHGKDCIRRCNGCNGGCNDGDGVVRMAVSVVIGFRGAVVCNVCVFMCNLCVLICVDDVVMCSAFVGVCNLIV